MTTVSIDPRLQARRSAVLRAEGRRRLRRLVIALTAVTLVIAAWFVSRSALLDVDSVTWSGLDQTALADAAAAAGVERGSALLGADPGTIADRLEALPWVESAHVDRSWFGTITIDVTERTAAALVMQEPGVWVVVDRTGRVLSTASEGVALPRLSGVRAAGAPGTDLSVDAAGPLEVLSLLPTALTGRVEGINRDDRGEMWISLNTADRILLGDDDQLGLKLVTVASVLESLDEQARTGWEMDVAVPPLAVVRDLRDEWRAGGA